MAIGDLRNIIGLPGVHVAENPKAKLRYKSFEKLRMVVVLWLLFQWYLDSHHYLNDFQDVLANEIVLFFFIIETWHLASLVDNKRRYLLQNWGNIVIITMGVPMLFVRYSPDLQVLQSMRLVLVFWLLIPWIDIGRQSLTDNKLYTTIGFAIIATIFFGVIISEIDPGIKSPADGIWWAWVTVSTLGYGDIVPHSLLGRLFASLLILMGLGLFSVITANYSAIFVQREMKGDIDEFKQEGRDIRIILKVLNALKDDEADIKNVVSHISEEEEKMVTLLTNIEQRLDKLEDRLNDN